MSYPGKMLNDGLCDPPGIEIPARQLLGTVCVCGGVDCPLFDNRGCAEAILRQVKADPTVSIRLTSDADRIPHYTSLDAADYAKFDREGMLNRKRDLEVLQRLGLSPGDTRRSRYLYELLLKNVASPIGICAYDTPNWDGCALARSGAYESVCAKGWSELVFDRTSEDKAEARRLSIERVRTDPVLKIRPPSPDVHELLGRWQWGGRNKRQRHAGRGL